jgi:hypothetical protein
MAKIQGTPCLRTHISARPATTKYFSNLFAFNTKIEKEGLPRDRTPDLGAGGLEFKSPRPDHLTRSRTGSGVGSQAPGARSS